MRQTRTGTGPGQPRRRNRRGRGFSLVEALVALGILSLVFTAVASAINAGTATSEETRIRVAATLGADELLAEVMSEDWSDLGAWDGHEEPADGDDGTRFTRRVAVAFEDRILEPSGIVVSGCTVTIEVRGADQRLLAELARFLAAPAEVGP